MARSRNSVALWTLLATALLGACAAPATGPDASTSPGVPAAPDISELPMPVPAGEVVVHGTVLDDGNGPQLCSVVAESYPPQCGGLVVVGWHWDMIEHDEASGVRWVNSARLQGTFDGATFAVTQAPTLADEHPNPPTHSPAAQQATDQIVADLDSLDRADISGWGVRDGVVHVNAAYDDGSMQEFFDELYGEGAVTVSSWMRDV